MTINARVYHCPKCLQDNARTVLRQFKHIQGGACIDGDVCSIDDVFYICDVHREEYIDLNDSGNLQPLY